MIEKLKTYIEELSREAEREANFAGCPITSMVEDYQIIAIGEEKRKIVRRLKEILTSGEV